MDLARIGGSIELVARRAILGKPKRRDLPVRGSERWGTMEASEAEASVHGEPFVPGAGSRVNG